MTPFRTAVAVAALAGLTACQNIPGLSSLTGSGSSGSSSTSSASSGSGGSGSATSLTAADQSFLTQAAYGGLAEVTLGETAQRKAAGADVRDLGRMLATDPDVRAFANKWLPPIRQHTDRIRTLTTRAVSSAR